MFAVPRESERDAMPPLGRKVFDSDSAHPELDSDLWRAIRLAALPAGQILARPP
jgi:hypothetical protein